MKTRFSPSLRHLFFAAAIWVSVVAGAAWFDWRGLLLVQKKTLSLSRAREAIAVLEGKRISVLEEQARVREHADDLRQVREIFVSADAPLQFFEAVERLAEKEGLSLKISVPKKKAEIMTMGIEAMGDERGILMFLKNLEKLPSQVMIQEMTLERFAGDSRDVKKTSSSEKVRSARVFAVIEFLAK